VGGLRTLLSGALVAALCVVVSMAAAAPAASPQSFVEAIDKTYLGKAARGIALTQEAVIRRYFAPPLPDAIVKDRAEADKRGEVPMLDGDPFVDAQDCEIARLRMSELHEPQEAKEDDARPREGRRRLAHRRHQGAEKGPSGSLRDVMKAK
jgi:hypothetical protein